MKSFKIALLAILTIALSATAAYSAASSGAPFYQLFSSTSLLTSAYTQAFSAAAVTKAVKGISVYNSGTHPIFIAVGAAGHEANQILAAPVTAGSPAVYYPLVVSQNQRISIIASVGTISTGEIDLNLFYN